MAISKNGRLVYAGAFGLADKSNNRLVTTTSLFRIASVSKPITAVAVSYVKQHVLGPCGISNMHLGGDTLAARRADEVVYSDQDGNDPYGMKVTRMDAHGGWIATATDLLRFAVRVDGFATKPDILSSSSITTMTTGSTANPGYARGWAVNSDGDWSHDGSLPGTQALLFRTADGFCWSALVNTRKQSGSMLGDVYKLMRDLKGKVAVWPGHDLF